MRTRLTSECSRLRATTLRRAPSQARHSSRCEQRRVVDPTWRAATLRPNQAEMSRGAFVALVTGWCGTLCAVLLAAAILRVIS
jgi:hypothetical protein